MKTPIEYFKEGYEGAEQGLTSQANPYIWDGWPRQSWHAGWRLYHEVSPMLELPDTLLKRVPAIPYEQGVNARRKLIGMSDCPYDPSSEDAAEWRRGWREENTGQLVERKERLISAKAPKIAYAVLYGLIIAGFAWVFFK